jgi:hypothetical protein
MYLWRRKGTMVHKQYGGIHQQPRETEKCKQNMRSLLPIYIAEIKKTLCYMLAHEEIGVQFLSRIDTITIRKNISINDIQVIATRVRTPSGEDTLIDVA